MENSKTTPESGTDAIDTEGGCKEIINSFRRFGLGQGGTPACWPSVVGGMNVVSSFGNAIPSPKEDDSLAVIQARIKMEKERSLQGIEIDQLPASIGREWPPANPVLEENIWAQPNVNNGMTLAENHDSSFQIPSPSAWNYQYDFYPSGNHMINGYGDFIPVTRNQFSDGNHTISGYRNFKTVMGSQFYDGNHVISGYRNFSTVMRSQFSDDYYHSQIRNGGYFMNDNIANPTYLPYQVQQNSSLQAENYLVMKARTRSGSEELQRLLEQGNNPEIQIILDGILGSMFELMIDDNGRYVFGVLVEKCQDAQLDSIIKKAEREPDRFVDVAFTDKGSKSIQRLIKRIKRIPEMATTITGILRRRSYELLTHKTGSHVIRQCFVILGEGPNLMLCEAISPRLLDLATDRVGCISVNNFLDSVTGSVRGEILNHLAEHSLFLSNDPSGNFVVQNLLNLNNQQVTEKIIHRLRGNFERLAQKQGGSHVIEKCMQSSELGIQLVVSELSKDGKVLLRLSRDQFGNYVIQTALKLTKIMSDKNLYRLLLNTLRPYYPCLLGKTRGRHVAELIKDDLGLQKAKSDE